MQLLDILDIYPIFSNLCSHLDISGILLLRKVTKKWARHLDVCSRSRWNINRKLSRFVDKPVGLRCKLAEVDALISGSFALQFFDDVVWEESDLDLFAEMGDGCNVLEEYLVNQEGYMLEQCKEQELVEIRTLRRQVKTGKGTKIQIIVTRGLPIQAVLRGLSTTAVVNVITWNKAYSFFPDATFIEHETHMLKPLDDYFGALLVKYSARGWMTLQTQWPEDCRSSHSLQLDEHHHVGDRKTWTIKLDLEGVVKSSTPDSVIEHACFAVETGERPEDIAAHFGMEMPDSSSEWYNIAAKSFRACVLKYRYTFAGTEAISGGDFWLSQAKRLSEMTYIEFMKMKREQRPELFEDRERERYFEWDGMFVKPATWTHYDEFVDGWFEAWDRGRVVSGRSRR